MLNIERVLKQDRLLRALTGLNRKAFEVLLVAFSPLYEQPCHTQPRQRAAGGGCKARLLGRQEKLFSILVGSRGTIKSRPSQLDLDVRVSVHPAPDILGFCPAPVLIIVATLIQCFQILLAPI